MKRDGAVRSLLLLGKNRLPDRLSMLLEAAVLQMVKCLNPAIGVAVACVLVSCAEQPAARVQSAAKTNSRRMTVRTTAYTRTEKGGRHNALGARLSSRHVMSAASDWSRFPLGTRFRIVNTKEEYVIDDYGTALVGTSTIDLYKSSRLEMRRWGVRSVDIDILEWGSSERSLQVLQPRKKHRQVREMIVSLQKKVPAGQPLGATQASNRTASTRTLD
jgi:3D (Asp-Asp-Asp) domain-containing protein